jgi:hypothetical protein
MTLLLSIVMKGLVMQEWCLLQLFLLLGRTLVRGIGRPKAAVATANEYDRIMPSPWRAVYEAGKMEEWEKEGNEKRGGSVSSIIYELNRIHSIHRSDSIASIASNMIFRARKSYSITLKRAHNLLGIPKDPPPSSSISHGQVEQVHISREQIQEAFRKAAKCYHPDIIAAAGRAGDNTATTTAAQTTQTIKNDANRTFRECNEARELLLDYYVNRKYIPPEVIESVKYSFDYQCV